MKIFVNVDTQKDFMDEDGALAVPGAGEIRPVLAKLTKLAKEGNIPVISTSDDHDGSEPEMAKNKGPFPLHCMKGTKGQKLIEETKMPNQIIFSKQCYNVFDKNLGNPDIKKYLHSINVDEAWVYGVVGNICVEAAVMGLLDMGIQVYVFENAVVWMELEQGIFCEGPDNKEQSMKRMREAGAMFAKAGL